MRHVVLKIVPLKVCMYRLYTMKVGKNRKSSVYESMRKYSPKNQHLKIFCFSPEYENVRCYF